MQIGSLVRPHDAFFQVNTPQWRWRRPGPEDAFGIVIDYIGTDPVVFWDDEYSYEREHAHQLEVIHDNR